MIRRRGPILKPGGNLPPIGTERPRRNMKSTGNAEVPPGVTPQRGPIDRGGSSALAIMNLRTSREVAHRHDFD